MMTIQEFDEKIAAIAKEMEELSAQRPDVLAEIGKKALPVLKDNPDFADVIAKYGKIDEKIESLKKQDQKLSKEKAQFEKQEKEKLAKRTCIACKHVNPDDAKFCEECGQELGILPREYCKECATMNQEGLKFCGECGTKLG